MPQIYAKQHDLFIEGFVNNLETKNKISERLAMAKNKMNYIVPVYLQVKVNYLIGNLCQLTERKKLIVILLTSL